MKRFVIFLTVLATGLAWVLGAWAPASALAQVPSGTTTVAGVSTPGGFTSVAPFRLLNTLTGVGAPQVAVAARGTVHLPVAGRGGVPASGVSAVVLNVSVVAPTSAGYITAFGGGTTRPGASNLNFVAGQTIPNLVIAPVGANGQVDLYNGSAGTVQLVADVAGYFLAGAPTVAGAFGSVPPSRLLNTLTGVGAPQVAVAARGTVHLPVAGRGGVPASGVSAVVLNVSVVAPTSAGYITAFGGGTTRPGASNLNFVAGQTIPNLVVAPVGANGQVDLYNGSAGTVQLVADVAGYYLAGPPDTTAPGPVSSVSTTATVSSVSLSWTNPVESDFEGVMIRRSAGATPPSSPTAGTLVTNTSAGTRTFTDIGLSAGAVYSYALFAHDAIPNYATMVSTTMTTTAAGSGAISGFVTDGGGAHHGLANVTVDVSSYSLSDVGTGTSGWEKWTATTAADGGYSVTGLPAGSDYRVCFTASSVTGSATGGSSDATGYLTQCFQNRPDWASATPVTVNPGATTTGINAALALGGAISGKVTESGGTQHGLANVHVNAYSSSANGGGYVTTTADGGYSVTGLPTGTDYEVCFNASGATGGSTDDVGYIDQCYNKQPTSGTPTLVTVVAGATRTATSAALTAAGAISGIVTDSAGTHHGLADVEVNVGSSSTNTGGYVTTAADGSYTVPGLAAGTDYQVCFTARGATGGSSDARGYVGQCYNNQPELGTPTLVPVALGATKTGINAALVGAGAVSGTVTDAGGTHHGLANVTVAVDSSSTGSFGSSTTDADGNYTVTGLAAGADYQVCFYDFYGATGGSADNLGYLGQCHPVTVALGVTRIGTNAALVGAGAVSGTVTEATGTHHGLANVEVTVSSPSTGGAGWGLTDSNGNYTVTDLEAGTDYQVCFTASGATGGSSDALGYVDQCYNNQPTSGTPTPVPVALGATKAGINAALVPNP